MDNREFVVDLQKGDCFPNTNRSHQLNENFVINFKMSQVLCESDKNPWLWGILKPPGRVSPEADASCTTAETRKIAFVTEMKTACID